MESKATVTNERRRQAEESRDKKIEFENNFRDNIESFFTEQLIPEVVDNYKGVGIVIGIEENTDNFTEVLIDNYRKIGGYFKNNLRRQINSSKNFETKQNANDIIDERLETFYELHAGRQVKEMNNTTMDEFDRNITQIRQELTEQGIEPTDVAIAERLEEVSQERARTRSQIIAQTETQIVSEQVKLTEAEVLEEENEVERVRKQWITMDDPAVRPAHSAANGQAVYVEEDFLVGGERLNMPGDPIGSPGNVINCRCNAVMIREDEV